MSQFYASIQGQRGEATRQGGKPSGIQGHIRGWEVGIRVVGHYDAKNDRDVFAVYRTGGSNGREAEEFLGIVTDGAVQPDERVMREAEAIDAETALALSDPDGSKRRKTLL